MTNAERSEMIERHSKRQLREDLRSIAGIG